jgi:hypothetical protein
MAPVGGYVSNLSESVGTGGPAGGRWRVFGGYLRTAPEKGADEGWEYATAGMLVLVRVGESGKVGGGILVASPSSFMRLIMNPIIAVCS